MDKRLQLLRSWIDRILEVSDYQLRPASVDASFRRYFRVFVGDQTYIAVDASPDKQDSQNYIRLAARFHQLGLNVPRVLEKDQDRGFFLITDLGDRPYLSQLNEATVDRLYGDALRALSVLQRGTDTEQNFLPDYDETLLLAEMQLFPEWYLGRQLCIDLTGKQHAVLDQTFDQLTRSALEQPRVWVHRDYHSRNLMVTRENNPGILDFQDAVYGPITYDLVSLLRDCYIAWPREQVENWARGYHTQALRSGIPMCEDPERFLHWFDRMGVQRHLKAAGIFARLKHRDGKPGYLGDIPRTLHYVQEVSARYADLQPLHGLLRELKLPGVTGEAQDR